jgi:hypothetical protein
MKLTPAVLSNLYASLACCYPYSRWKMPLPEEIHFVVTDDPELMGTYLYSSDEFEHTITVSSARCGHYYTVLTTLCHEMIHMSFYRQKGDKWLHHGKPFRDRCKLVATELGLDPLEL